MRRALAHARLLTLSAASASLTACGPTTTVSEGRDAALVSDANTIPVDRVDSSRPDAGVSYSDAGDAAAVDTDASVQWATRVYGGPNYLGSVGGISSCPRVYKTIGFAPVSGEEERHPLFLYFVGTLYSDDDASGQYDRMAPSKVTEAMARRGFVALSVDYDNGPATGAGKLGCLFSKDNKDNILATACALPEVDCDLGIATWGHGQGAIMAHSAAYYDKRIRAVWTTGYAGVSGVPISPQRFRVVNGEHDVLNSGRTTLNRTADFNPEECPDDGRSECLREDGSGWILVRKADCGFNSADLCWFNKASCATKAETLEPSWADETSTVPFALELNADWVANTVRR